MLPSGSILKPFLGRGVDISHELISGNLRRLKVLQEHKHGACKKLGIKIDILLTRRHVRNVHSWNLNYRNMRRSPGHFLKNWVM